MKNTMTNTVNGVNIITSILGALYRSEEKLCRAAAEAAAEEIGCAYAAGGADVKLFTDSTGSYAEVTLSGGYDCACGMKLCCIVDTDTMQVRGVCPVGSL